MNNQLGLSATGLFDSLVRMASDALETYRTAFVAAGNVHNAEVLESRHKWIQLNRIVVERSKQR